MRFEIEKCMRIVSDIVGFCCFQGSVEIDVNLRNDKENNVNIMKITSRIENLDISLLKQFTKAVRIPRQHEIEETYWELSGETEYSGELTLVGMMADEAQIDYTDEILTITIYRKE